MDKLFILGLVVIFVLFLTSLFSSQNDQERDSSWYGLVGFSLIWFFIWLCCGITFGKKEKYKRIQTIEQLKTLDGSSYIHAFNEDGYSIKIDKYQEVLDIRNGKKVYLNTGKYVVPFGLDISFEEYTLN